MISKFHNESLEFGKFAVADAPDIAIGEMLNPASPVLEVDGPDRGDKIVFSDESRDRELWGFNVNRFHVLANYLLPRKGSVANKSPLDIVSTVGEKPLMIIGNYRGVCPKKDGFVVP